MHSVALLYSPRITTREDHAAAMRGLEQFQKFGLLVDALDVDTRGVGHVRGGEMLRVFAASTTPIHVDNSLGHRNLANIWHTIWSGQQLTTGIAITSVPITRTQPIFQESWTGRRGREWVPQPKEAIGISIPRAGAVVNVREFDFIRDATIRHHAIMLVITHELGHVFGVVQHCATPECIMQDAARTPMTIEDDVRRYNLQKPDFCTNCVETIRREIDRLTGKVG